MNLIMGGCISIIWIWALCSFSLPCLFKLLNGLDAVERSFHLHTYLLMDHEYPIFFIFKEAALILIFICSTPASLTLAWGVDGHYTTCALAQSLFTQATNQAVQDLLPADANGDLPSLCSWADEIRRFHNYQWSAPLHFIDTPDNLCNFNYARDCHNSEGIPDMCAAGAINNFTSQLTTYQSSDSQYNLTEALLFLAHIVGDIHQPLHVGFTGDKGGNTIPVHWYTRSVDNLHHVWDDDIIDTAEQKYYQSDVQGLIDYLKANITNDSADVSRWSSCNDNEVACPNTYATESINAACNWAYKGVTPDIDLGDAYFTSRLPVVEQRLIQGGVRLAAILNRVFT